MASEKIPHEPAEQQDLQEAHTTVEGGVVVNRETARATPVRPRGRLTTTYLKFPINTNGAQ